jgi:hypothetical protein
MDFVIGGSLFPPPFTMEDNITFLRLQDIAVAKSKTWADRSLIG